MSISTVVTEGYGPSASIALVVTSGYALGEAVVVAPDPYRPPQTGGAVLGRSSRRAGSGLFVRVDQDVVEITAAKATARGRTCDVAMPPVLGAEPATACGCTRPVEVTATASLAASASVVQGRTSRVAITRDDTAEIARLIALMPKAKRLSVDPPADVKDLYDLIDKMKKKAA